MLRTVKHLFRLGSSIPWRTVSHNQMVVIPSEDSKTKQKSDCLVSRVHLNSLAFKLD